MNIKTSIANEDEHVEQIQKLAHRIWWKHYPDVISDEQIAYMLEGNYSTVALNKQRSEGTVFHLIRKDENPVGFVAVAPYQKEAHSYFIHKFYLDTAEHNKGLGTLVFQKMVDLYPDAFVIRLAVNRQNYKSINFYFKNGFKIEKCLDTDIGRGFVMDDFIMVWKRH